MNASLNKWFFRPFEHLSEFKALLIGISAILLSGGLNILSQTHFDGIVDVHTGSKEISSISFVCEGLIDWLLFSALLFTSSLFFSSSAIRLIDVISTQAMARWPLLITSLATLIIPHQAADEYLLSKVLKSGTEINIQAYQLILLGLLTLIIVATSIWMIVLMYRAYSISCNLKGNKAIAIFIITLLLAEGISKYLISHIL